MAIWKPAGHIRVVVIGLVWRGDALLAFEVEGSSGRIDGVRPLGGAVEFGETRERALAREFREELGCGIAITGPWHAFENLYEHEGHIGHEIVFGANIELADRRLYERERIEFREDEGTRCTAAWFDPRRLPEGLDLYPDGLLPLIESGAVSSLG